MCEHQQKSIKHVHSNIMWLIFLCSSFLQQAHWRWLHKNCWWLIIMALGEHFTLVPPASHALRSFLLLAGWWPVRSTWHACILECHSQRQEQRLLFGCLPESLYWRWQFLSTLSHYIRSATVGAGVEHWAQGGRISRALNRKIISLPARGIQTVNRESKHVDVNLLCCNHCSRLDCPRNNSI